MRIPALILLAAWAVLPLSAQTTSSVKRTEDVIYGRKYGVALTLDVFEPAKPNGCAIVWLVSGGWYSARQSISPRTYQVFLDRGYTVFAVVHGSQPKFTIPEITADVHRAVRFIRHHAARWSVNPDKLGVGGGSAGGHLSLMLGTGAGRDWTAVPKGGPAWQPPLPKPDEVDATSSAVQAVACFFPPTDFLNYGEPGAVAVGVGRLKDFKAAFGPKSDAESDRQAYGKEISPADYVSEKLPPTLIIHGDADKVVPIQQAELFVKKAQAAGATAKLIVKEGKAHGWPDMLQDYPLLADWFDVHLRGIKPGS